MIEERATTLWRNHSRKGVPCGIGSTLENTEIIRDYIEVIIKKYNIKSITDAPCGDYSWMSLVDKQQATYNGYDINYEMLSENKLNYPDVMFAHLDITTTMLPKTDLIICRDCLIHLCTEDNISVLSNFKKSGSKYLLSTTFDSVSENCNIADGYERETGYGFRRVNLKIDPYNLGDSIDHVYEPVFDRFLALWELN